METNTNLSLWLDELPPAEEIRINPDGFQYLPIDVVKRKLDFLTGNNWDTKNFNHFLLNHNGSIKVYGSMEVCVSYRDGDLYTSRTLVGAATFDIKDYDGNKHWSATLKSLCIVNAAQDLGRQFGRYFNPEPEPSNNPAKKLEIQEQPEFHINK